MQTDLIDLSLQKMNQMGAPAACIAALTGIATSDLSAYLNKQRPVPHHKARLIYDTTAKLEQLVNALAPIPLDYRRGGLIKLIVEKFDSQSLIVFVDEIAEMVGAPIEV
jgi:hypothetical protein